METSSVLESRNIIFKFYILQIIIKMSYVFKSIRSIIMTILIYGLN